MLDSVLVDRLLSLTISRNAILEEFIMTTATCVKTAKYLYSFVDSQDVDEVLKLGCQGLNGENIEAIREGNLSAIVSAIEDAKIRPQRKLLAAHQSVVTGIAQRLDALPVSFGLVASSEDQVRRLLIQNGEVLRSQLQRIAGKTEMFVSVSWSAENIFQYFVQRYEDLAYFRDRLAAGQATRDEQVEVGRIFERYLQQEREEHSQRVLHVLRPLCAEVDSQPVRNEREILRLACLINRSREEAFNTAFIKQRVCSMTLLALRSMALGLLIAS